MAFLHLTFDNFEFRDLGHFNFVSFKVLAPTRKSAVRLVEFQFVNIRVDAPFVATVLIVAIFAITFFKSLFFHIFVLVFGCYLSKSMKQSTLLLFYLKILENGGQKWSKGGQRWYIYPMSHFKIP